MGDDSRIECEKESVCSEYGKECFECWNNVMLRGSKPSYFKPIWKGAFENLPIKERVSGIKL